VIVRMERLWSDLTVVCLNQVPFKPDIFSPYPPHRYSAVSSTMPALTNCFTAIAVDPTRSLYAGRERSEGQFRSMYSAIVRRASSPSPESLPLRRRPSTAIFRFDTTHARHTRIHASFGDNPHQRGPRFLRLRFIQCSAHNAEFAGKSREVNCVSGI